MRPSADQSDKGRGKAFINFSQYWGEVRTHRLFSLVAQELHRSLPRSWLDDLCAITVPESYRFHSLVLAWSEKQMPRLVGKIDS
jgi:hypothetical protein